MKTAQLNSNAQSALDRLKSRIVGDKLLDLPVDSVEEDPENPREFFDPSELHDLANSIRANNNRLIHPIVVREMGVNRWRIIDGARRYRACTQILGFERVQCIVPGSIDSVILMQLLANDQHENLTPIERAKALDRLRSQSPEKFPNLEALGKAVGRGKAWVSKHLQLLELPEPILALANSGRVTDLDSLYLLQKLPQEQLGEAVTQIEAGSNARELLTRMTAEHRQAEAVQRPAKPAAAATKAKPTKDAPPRTAGDALLRRVHQAVTALGLPTPVVKSTKAGVTLVTLALDEAGLDLLERIRPPR